MTASRRARPESTLARRPTDFKSAASIESKATQGLPEDRRLSLDEKTSKITLTSWVNSIRAYMEEHGMDTVFRIYDSAKDSEVYLLQDWGSSDPLKVSTWEATIIGGIGTAPPCEYDIDNLKWSGKAIMNSISLDLWETIEKDVGVGSNGPVTYAAVISKIQQVSASSVRALVDNLKKMHLLQEPGQDVEAFGSKIIEMTRRITGSGLAPTDLTSIVAGCFIDCDVLAFKLKALSFFDAVDDNAASMTWEEIVRQLKAKYRSLLGQDFWEPQKRLKTADTSTLDGLHAAINKLSAQVSSGAPPGKKGPPSGTRTVTMTAANPVTFVMTVLTRALLLLRAPLLLKDLLTLASLLEYRRLGVGLANVGLPAIANILPPPMFVEVLLPLLPLLLSLLLLPSLPSVGLLAFLLLPNLPTLGVVLPSSMVDSSLVSGVDRMSLWLTLLWPPSSFVLTLPSAPMISFTVTPFVLAFLLVLWRRSFTMQLVTSSIPMSARLKRLVIPSPLNMSALLKRLVIPIPLETMLLMKRTKTTRMMNLVLVAAPIVKVLAGSATSVGLARTLAWSMSPTTPPPLVKTSSKNPLMIPMLFHLANVSFVVTSVPLAPTVSLVRTLA